MSRVPCGPESVAFLTALHTGVDEIAVDMLAELDSDTLAVLAVTYGYTLLHAWRALAVMAEVDNPDDYVKAKLAQIGVEVAT